MSNKTKTYNPTKAYVGPEFATLPRGFASEQTERVSQAHDQAYENLKDPYTKTSKADIDWITKTSWKDPVALLGQTFFKTKALATQGATTKTKMPLTGKRGRSYTSPGVKKRREVQAVTAQKLQAAAKNLVSNLHYHDTSVTVGTSVGGAGSENVTSLISGISQGDNATQRLGNKVTLQSLYLRGRAVSLADVQQVAVRMLVVVDKQANGATPTLAEVLNTADASADINAIRNMDNTDRYWVLRDKTIFLNSTAGAWSTVFKTPQQVKPFQLKVRWPKGLTVSYDKDGDGTSSTIRDNNVWLIVYASAGSAANYDLEARVRFYA